MTEKEFSEMVVNRLSSYFFVQEERWSKCNKFRIDYVLQDRINPDVFFGIEFKKADYKRGENIGSHILQSIRYSLSEFETTYGNHERIPILLCPPISYNYLMCPVPESKKLMERMSNIGLLGRDAEYYHDRHDKHSKHHTINGLLGALNTGEVRTSLQQNKQKLNFSFSNQQIWSEEKLWDGTGYNGQIKGIDLKKYETLINKINQFRIL